MEYIIPIGSDCSVASYIRDKNIRICAFPFDWVVIPMASALQLIETNFKDFLKEDNLTFLPQASRKVVVDDKNEGQFVNDIITPCYCKKYHMLLPHDFSKEGKVELLQVQSKYQKRITRMFQLLEEPDNSFIFIANDAPTNPLGWRAQQYNQAAKKPFVNDFVDWKNRLADVLKNKYPNLKYTRYTLKEFKK